MLAFFFFAAFFFALGRAFFLAAFFFFFAFFFAFGLEDGRDDSSIGIDGVGAGVGADGNIGSMNPGPGQLLSVTSVCSSIGSSPMLIGAGASWVAYSLPPDSDLASDRDFRPSGITHRGPS
ncbi:MAG: hypothetical protein AUI09_05135 [Gemmatimonadetes bacterium 13_2_20CM_2_66_5]|nr:MAG: hypothetical protein AUI09_05135 [Gemmatimonadetes bacterium 13_2_20CM_2_66_5]